MPASKALIICAVAYLICAKKSYFAIMRPRSKHTSLFLPIDSWILPEVELREAYASQNGLSTMSFEPFEALVGLSPLSSNVKLVVIDDSTETINALIKASAQTVLLHGLYEIWAIGNCIEDKTLLDQAISYLGDDWDSRKRNIDDNQPAPYSSFSSSGNCSVKIAVGVFDQPQLGKELIQKIISRFDPICEHWASLHCCLNSSSIVENQDIRIFCNSRALQPFSPEISDDDPQSKTIGRDDHQKSLSGFVVISRRVASGIAAPKCAGMGGHDPLPISTAYRRPTSGILSRFALHKLPYRTPTAMEPELGLLMANLARVGGNRNTRNYSNNSVDAIQTNAIADPIHVGENENDRQIPFWGDAEWAMGPVRGACSVLDPFCGCGALLLAAAHQGATHVVGLDAAMTAASSRGIVGNFVSQELGGTSCVLLEGLAEQLLENSRSGFNVVEAIEAACAARPIAVHAAASTAVAALSDHSSGSDSQMRNTIFEAAWRGLLFDAILTDPPYDMREKVASSPAVTSLDQQSRTAVDAAASRALSAIETLLHIASEKLRPGGRLVFFAPQRAAANCSKLEQVESDLSFKSDLVQDKRRWLLQQSNKKRSKQMAAADSVAEILGAYQMDIIGIETKLITGGKREREICNQRKVLQELYTMTGGQHWKRRSNWFTEHPLGEWEGVITNESAEVISLDLASNNLRVQLPSSLGSLTNLKELNLRRNGLTGELPLEVFEMLLKMLALHEKKAFSFVPFEPSESAEEFVHDYKLCRSLKGAYFTLPANIGELELTTTELDLSAAYYLKGEIPSSFGNLTGLTRLRITQTFISGDIAPLAGLTNLTDLVIWSNEALSGDIAALRGLTNLTSLDIRRNCLHGDIAVIDGLPSLTHLDFECIKNALTGELPLCAIELASRSYIQKRDGSFRHENPAGNFDDLYWSEQVADKADEALSVFSLPENIGDLDLSITLLLDLHYFSLTGEITASISRLTNLTSLRLYGAIDGGFEHVLPLTQLRELHISGFWEVFEDLPVEIRSSDDWPPDAGDLQVQLGYLRDRLEAAAEPLM